MTRQRLLFLTGTRADYGKLKPLILSSAEAGFEVHIVVTGMHMLRKYGFTYEHVAHDRLGAIHSFMNQTHSDSMDVVLAKTVSGLSDYVKELTPDLIVVHGDRVEALAGAIVGSLNNVRVAHVEGGEVSGTVDELIRHAVSKLSHVHFVANEEARARLIQLGERPDSIYVIGSPDLDVMSSATLPSFEEVRERYEIPFEEYGLLLFHPVTTEQDDIGRQAAEVVSAVLDSGRCFVVVYPNNDLGSDDILDAYAALDGHERIRLFPSMRFEYFLTLMKRAEIVLGNSSAGVREAPFYGIPSINIGSRQNRRASCQSIFDCAPDRATIARAIEDCFGRRYGTNLHFGDGMSSGRFNQALLSQAFWKRSCQKHFVDMRER